MMSKTTIQITKDLQKRLEYFKEERGYETYSDVVDQFLPEYVDEAVNSTMEQLRSVTLTLGQIKRDILKYYLGDSYDRYIDGDINRELLIVENKDNYGQVGSIFFSLVGSPPKGFAIYVPGGMWCSIIDRVGRTRKVYSYCHVDFDEKSDINSTMKPPIEPEEKEYTEEEEAVLKEKARELMKAIKERAKRQAEFE